MQGTGKGTAPPLWYSCQKCQTWLESRGNSMWTQFKGHPQERRVCTSQNCQRHERQGERKLNKSVKTWQLNTTCIHGYDPRPENKEILLGESMKYELVGRVVSMPIFWFGGLLKRAVCFWEIDTGIYGWWNTMSTACSENFKQKTVIMGIYVWLHLYTHTQTCR